MSIGVAYAVKTFNAIQKEKKRRIGFEWGCGKVKDGVDIFLIYKSSSSSSGSGAARASSSSRSACNICAWSTMTSGGASAGASANSRFGSPASFRAWV
jgi:hypothetical protein